MTEQEAYLGFLRLMTKMNINDIKEDMEGVTEQLYCDLVMSKKCRK